MTTRRVPGGDQPGVDLDLAADDRARRSRAGSRTARRGVRPGRSSTSWLARGGARRPRAATGSATRILTRRPRRRPERRARAPRRAATCAAATAAPGRTSRPAAIEAISSVLIAPRISSSVTEPRWPSRKILPVSLPWPPARTTPRRLTSPLNAFQSRPSGTQRGGDRPRRDGRVGEQLEAERRAGRPASPRRTPRGGRRRPPRPPRPSAGGPRRPGRRPRWPASTASGRWPWLSRCARRSR